MNDTQCTDVPLVEQLRSVPREWREIREVGYCSHRNVPYGEFCHKAAERIAYLELEIAVLRDTTLQNIHQKRVPDSETYWEYYTTFRHILKDTSVPSLSWTERRLQDTVDSQNRTLKRQAKELRELKARIKELETRETIWSNKAGPTFIPKNSERDDVPLFSD